MVFLGFQAKEFTLEEFESTQQGGGVILFAATGHKKKGGGLAAADERFSMSHCYVRDKFSHGK